MGRPDLTAQRTEEILDAFAQCVARFGLEGSSLERVAEEAGMKRSILRHYVGNREDLVLALARRVVSAYRSELAAFMDSLPETGAIRQLIDYYLPPQPRGSTESVLVIEALIAASELYPDVRELMMGYVDNVVDLTTARLQKEFPSASRQACWGVAYGVISVWFNQESLTSLQLPPKYLKAARSSVRKLIDSLG